MGRTLAGATTAITAEATEAATVGLAMETPAVLLALAVPARPAAVPPPPPPAAKVPAPPSTIQSRPLGHRHNEPYFEEPRMLLIVVVELLHLPIEDAESMI